MKRTLLGILVAMGLLVPVTLSRPSLAMASGEWCSIGEVNVTGDAFHHKYDYVHGYRPHPLSPCEPAFHVTASYDVTSQKAYGAINRIGAVDVVEAGTWMCPSDPWSDSLSICSSDLHVTFVDCGSRTDFVTEHICNWLDNQPAEPASAFFLTDQDRHGLAAQLGNAIRAQASNILNTPAGAATHLGTGASSIPALPDLAVTDIRLSSTGLITAGSTLVYDVVVANTGAKLSSSGQVQVQIQVSGSVSYTAMAETPAGFSCSGANPVVCVGPIGGYGDPPITTSAIFRVQVHADKTGLGSVSAAADPNDLIHESDENNNAKTLPVTVK